MDQKQMMTEETFAELMQSVAEGAKIFRGELPPASEFVHYLIPTPQRRNVRLTRQRPVPTTLHGIPLLLRGNETI